MTRTRNLRQRITDAAKSLLDDVDAKPEAVEENTEQAPKEDTRPGVVVELSENMSLDILIGMLNKIRDELRRKWDVGYESIKVEIPRSTQDVNYGKIVVTVDDGT